jgi:hypothetical protein
MKELTLLMVIVLLIFVWTTYIRKNMYLTKVKAVTGDSYLVRKLPDNQAAADKLGGITRSLQKLCDHCRGEQGEKKEGVLRLTKKFKPHRIIEHMPGNRYVAHSVDKGQELSICIRDKGTNQFMDDQVILFVAIHELAHIMTVSTGHTEEFWDNMRYLLGQASSIGIYTPVDYAKSPVDYCGMEISSTPLRMDSGDLISDSYGSHTDDSNK